MRIARVVLAAAAATAATTACAATPSQSPQGARRAAASPQGLTFAELFVAGSTIDSPNVDVAATYLAKRNISILNALGALTGDAYAVAVRADGIIASSPADGYVSIEELVRLEDPTFFATLFPAEKAAEPGIWKLLETTASATSTPVSVPAFPTMKSEVVEAFVPPDPLDALLVQPITELPAALRTTASRIELVYDSDGDPTTISLDDVTQALADTSIFTPGDVADFWAIRDKLAGMQDAGGVAEVNVPPPGETTTVVPLSGPLVIKVATTTSYSETRTYRYHRYYAEGLLSDLQGRRNTTATVSLPAGAEAVLVDPTGEQRLSAGAPGSLSAGTYVLEIWEGARRTWQRSVELPKLAFNPWETLDLRDVVGATLVSGGAPLQRNIKTGRYISPYMGGSAYTTTATYDLASLPVPSGVDKTAITVTEIPSTGLDAGQYVFPLYSGATATLHVYPQNVMTVTYAGTTRHFSPHQFMSHVDFALHSWGGVYEPSTRRLWFRLAGGSGSVDADLPIGVRMRQ